jgi:hypothetical protein
MSTRIALPGSAEHVVRDLLNASGLFPIQTRMVHVDKTAYILRDHAQFPNKEELGWPVCPGSVSRAVLNIFQAGAIFANFPQQQLVFADGSGKAVRRSHCRGLSVFIRWKKCDNGANSADVEM